MARIGARLLTDLGISSHSSTAASASPGIVLVDTGQGESLPVNPMVVHLRDMLRSFVVVSLPRRGYTADHALVSQVEQIFLIVKAQGEW